MISSRVLCCLFVTTTLEAAELPTGVDLPIDTELEASIVAATRYFHPENCVSKQFKTTLEEYKSYWSVTLVELESDDASTCSARTVFVCRANGRVVIDDPESACAT